MSSIPSQMKAVVIKNKAAVIDTIPVPELEANDVLVKVDYVALNPTDWKHVKYIGVDGSICGCDYSGTIVKLGQGLKDASKKVGDRVAGAVHGGKFPNKGSFAEYLKVESDVCFKVPESVSQKQASSYGVPYVTAAQTLYSRLHVPIPPAKADGSEWILINGGSSSVGFFGVQMAKHSGYKVVATASPKNFDLVKEYGADEVVSYRDAAAASKQIKEITNNTLTKALDCISESDSVKLALESFSDKPGHKKLQLLLQQPEDTKTLSKEKDVEVETTMAYTLFGKAFTLVPGVDLPEVPSDRAFYVELNKKSPSLITETPLKANPLDEGHGFEGILDGLARLEKGVSAVKLVYKL